ncbi:MAG: non-ribosomal peptide synthetase [Catenulispora sp.]|nr:non-ribosomal peptide synthetase [Catenulispora sp.]
MSAVEAENLTLADPHRHPGAEASWTTRPVELDGEVRQRLVEDFADPADQNAAVLAAFEYGLKRLSGRADFVIGCSGPDLRPIPIRAVLEPGSAFERLHDLAASALHAAQPETFGDRPATVWLRLGNAAPPAGELELIWHGASSAVSAEFRYDTARLSPETVERLAVTFVRTLRAGLTTPLEPLATAVPTTVPVPAPAQPADRGAPQSVPLPSLLAQHAHHHPDRIALIAEDGTFTYGDLHRRVIAFARLLLARGISTGDLVAVCLERRSTAIVAILGTLASGAAYLPLDPTTPVERLRYVLDDADADLFVGDPAVLGDRFPAGLAVALASDVQACADEAFAPEPPTPPMPVLRPQDLAYIIYTSGSTGRPKGVAIRHADLSCVIQGAQQATGVTPDERLIAVSTLSFDMSVADIFLPLAVAGSMVLATWEQAREPRELARLALRTGGTFLNSTPVTWQSLMALADPEWLPTRGFSSGEAMPSPLGREIARRVPQAWNLYGPTETTIWATAHRMADVPHDGWVPIGRPLPATTAYVLDDEFNPCEPGVVGELYLGGGNVGAGYVNRPELTAEKFLPDPFGPPGSRMYRSGDVCRVLPDGQIEFLGRADNQVKIHGYRIELDEITNRILEHPAVREAVVLEVEAGSRRHGLAAYAVGVPGVDADLRRELAAWTAAALPSYMVPGRFRILDALPRMANGKIDRSRLPSVWDEPAPTGDRTPCSPTEERLCALWGQALEGPPVGRRDDFLALGGDSVSALEVIESCRREFGVKVPLRALFTAPTPAELAALIDAGSFAAA